MERRIDRCQKAAKGDRKFAAEAELLSDLKAHLEEGLPARSWPKTEERQETGAQMPLLSGKPVIYAANLSESDFAGDIKTNPHYQTLDRIAEAEGALVLPICAKIEEELSGSPREDKLNVFVRAGAGILRPDRLIAAGYELLGLVSFLTAGKPEVRAWTIQKGTRAPQAAGKIHSNFERGFIRAEVISYDDLIACGSMGPPPRKKVLSVRRGKITSSRTAT